MVIHKKDGVIRGQFLRSGGIITAGLIFAPRERQFSDDQLKLIIERDGVIGGALDIWMLHPSFEMAKSNSKEMGINLEKLVDHFDHICQLTGNSNHIGFGTDLDGLFGTEQTPYDLDTIADITKFKDILHKRGYDKKDTENILSGNWLRVLRKALGEN